MRFRLKIKIKCSKLYYHRTYVKQLSIYPPFYVSRGRYSSRHSTIQVECTASRRRATQGIAMVCTVTAAVLAHVAPWTPEKLHVLYPRLCPRRSSRAPTRVVQKLYADLCGAGACVNGVAWRLLHGGQGRRRRLWCREDTQEVGKRNASWLPLVSPRIDSRGVECIYARDHPGEHRDAEDDVDDNCRQFAMLAFLASNAVTSIAVLDAAGRAKEHGQLDVQQEYREGFLRHEQRNLEAEYGILRQRAGKAGMVIILIA
jgi:hypothetical protein